MQYSKLVTGVLGYIYYITRENAIILNNINRKEEPSKNRTTGESDSFFGISILPCFFSQSR